MSGLVNMMQRISRTGVIGFTLLEVLVALFVLSIGLLGVAALQATGLRYTHESYLRTQAVFQSYDILDRMRANPTAQAAGEYDFDAKSYGIGEIPSGTTNCATTSCDPVELSEYDIAQWNTNNDALLPEGKGKIETNGGIHTITIQWVEKDLPMELVVTAGT